MTVSVIFFKLLTAMFHVNKHQIHEYVKIYSLEFWKFQKIHSELKKNSIEFTFEAPIVSHIDF